jgi:hypothetical protein
MAALEGQAQAIGLDETSIWLADLRHQIRIAPPLKIDHRPYDIGAKSRVQIHGTNGLVELEFGDPTKTINIVGEAIASAIASFLASANNMAEPTILSSIPPVPAVAAAAFPRPVREKGPARPRPRRHCQYCGQVVAARRRRYCNHCGRTFEATI